MHLTTGRRHHHHRTHATPMTTTTTTTTAAPHSHHGHGAGIAPVTHRRQKRHATIGDKVSGAMLRLRGMLTHRSGKIGAGTKRMHGTDGRGSRRRGWTTTRRV